MASSVTSLNIQIDPSLSGDDAGRHYDGKRGAGVGTDTQTGPRQVGHVKDDEGDRRGGQAADRPGHRLHWQASKLLQTAATKPIHQLA